MTLSLGPRPSLRVAPFKLSIAKAALEARSYLTYATASNKISAFNLFCEDLRHTWAREMGETNCRRKHRYVQAIISRHASTGVYGQQVRLIAALETKKKPNTPNRATVIKTGKA